MKYILRVYDHYYLGVSCYTKCSTKSAQCVYKFFIKSFLCLCFTFSFLQFLCRSSYMHVPPFQILEKWVQSLFFALSLLIDIIFQDFYICVCEVNLQQQQQQELLIWTLKKSQKLEKIRLRCFFSCFFCVFFFRSNPVS